MKILDDINILIVGNDRRFNKSLQGLLFINGYQSQIALTEEETVTLLQQNRFSLVILNLVMIEIYGQQLMEQVKIRKGNSKLIMISQDSIFDMVVWALRQGADDFFKMPYSPDELLLSIHNQLNHQIPVKENWQNHTRLLNSELLHRYMIDNLPDIIYFLDKKGRFSFFNRQVEMLLGFPRKELLGKHYSTLVHPEDREKIRHVFSERRTGQRASKNVELRLLNKNGETSPNFPKQFDVDVELHATGVYKSCKENQERFFLGTYGVLRDISERKKREKQFHRQLYRDSLTDLPNRTLFQDRLRLALCQASRNSHSLAVMFLDIDEFKEINDSFGHACGDALLQLFSVRLKSCLRESDTLARISGDEFNVLIPRITSCEDTKRIASKIIDEFKVSFKIENFKIKIGVSIGIALSPGDSDSGEELIQKADWAMYYVKHHGKNGFMHYEDGLQGLARQYSLEVQ